MTRESKMEKEQKDPRREKEIRKKLKEMQRSGLEFVFEETPDTYIVKFNDKEGRERTFHFLKMNGTLPVGGERYKIEDVIKAVLLFPNDSIENALFKLYDSEKN